LGAETGADAGGGEGDALRFGPQVTFRRLLTDPAPGTLTALAEKRYRPSTALDRAVRARDVTYRFPGCRRSANSAGTDLKHTTRWNVTLDPSGVMTWTTPTGRTYQTEPWHCTDPNPPPRG
ncbi:MAG: hypothetical protein LH645_12855, partial [Actinomycetia bacterium]|nr:hypothetical protein [Actinomycetes bacterium]